jgi:signal transduction histidine kinase
MAEDTAFARLVSLACHDLRTPLATAYGFARTLTRSGLEQPTARYMQMVADATQEMGDLLDTLALATRIESGRYEPQVEEVDTGDLARAGAARARDTQVDVRAAGTAPVRVDREPAERALADLARCAQRHGGLDRVGLAAVGAELRISPVVAEAAPVVIGEDLKDLGAAVAVRFVRALGGDVQLAGEVLVVGFPPA